MRTIDADSNPPPAYYLNQSVAKAVAILRAFSHLQPIRGVGELSDELGMTRSVTQKLMLTLCDLGLLEQEPVSRKYRISPRVLEIAGPFLRTSPLIREGSIVLKELVNRTEMTCALGIRQDSHVLYLVSIEAQTSVKANSVAGERTPIYCSATGKCLLAFADADTKRAVLASLHLEPLTEHTITDLAALAAELGKIATRGYAINNEERVIGLCGVAVPITNNAGEAVAALSVGIPKGSVSQERFEEIIQLARSEGANLSHVLEPYDKTTL